MFSTIVDRYAEYVKKHYKKTAIIISDGYQENLEYKGIKGAECARRISYKQTMQILIQQRDHMTSVPMSLVPNDLHLMSFLQREDRKLNSAASCTLHKNLNCV